MPAQSELPRAPVVFSGSTDVIAPASEITQLLHFAIEHGAAVETMERLVALRERMEDRDAAKEFAEAVAKFQELCPILTRKTSKKIDTDGGGSYTIRYAELGQIAKEIAPVLKECGLAYTWDTTSDGKLVTVTCILRHVNGHREAASFTCPPTGTRAMSEPQKAASAVTYGKRQSLIQVLGITTADPDDDGMDLEPVSPAQAKAIRAMLADVGADEKKFLAVMGVPSVEQIPMRSLNAAMNALRQKERQRERKGGAS